MKPGQPDKVQSTSFSIASWPPFFTSSLLYFLPFFVETPFLD